MDRPITYEQYENEAYEFLKTEYEKIGKIHTDTGDQIYHIMLHGRKVDDEYKKFGQVHGVHCECFGNPEAPKWHHHFIFTTSIKQGSLQKRVNRLLTKILILDAPKKFYARNKIINNEFHLWSVLLYITCHGKIKDHKHFNCTPYSLTTKSKRKLLKRAVEDYDLIDQQKDYIEKNGLRNDKKRNYYLPVIYTPLINKWIQEKGLFDFEKTPRTYKTVGNWLILKGMQMYKDFSEYHINEFVNYTPEEIYDTLEIRIARASIKIQSDFKISKEEYRKYIILQKQLAKERDEMDSSDEEYET